LIFDNIAVKKKPKSKENAVSKPKLIANRVCRPPTNKKFAPTPFKYHYEIKKGKRILKIGMQRKNTLFTIQYRGQGAEKSRTALRGAHRDRVPQKIKTIQK